ncbi:MAG: hypothetical protein ABL903_19875 [Methylococcales bacterium]
MPKQDESHRSDLVRISFMVLALLFSLYAMFGSESWLPLGYVDNTVCRQEAAAVLVYVVGLISTHNHYNRGEFVADEGYLWHVVFWLSIALLSLFLKSTPLFYAHPFNEGYWHKTVLWVLFILTVTLPPAIYQHRSDVGIAGVLLLMMDSYALVFTLFYFILPSVSPLILMVGAGSFSVIAIMILVKLSSVLHLKQLTRHWLYNLAFWINFAGLVVFVGVFHRLSSGNCI